MFARPVNVRVVADGQQQFEFFLEEGIVIFQFEAEEQVGFDRRNHGRRRFRRARGRSGRAWRIPERPGQDPRR